MAYLNNTETSPKKKNKFHQKIWVRIAGVILVLLLLVGGVFTWKAGNILNKISGGKMEIFSNILHSLPGASNELEGEEEGRINILLLGMRGENVPGGGLLADTIIVASVAPQENKVAMISIPRDLYVDNPVWGHKTKINAVYAAGEENGKKEGMEMMQKVVSEITGLPIKYGASINFEGFKQLIDAIGGVEITLDQPFSEALQFKGLEKRCDGVTYTIPSGNYEEKRIKRKNGTYYANPKRYPLCYAKQTPATVESLECGGNFSLSVGKQTLNGEQALCFVRSRVTSSDFERAKRQQLVLKLAKDKMLSLGTLTDFSKVNEMLDALGNNVRVSIQAWEMMRFFELYQKMNNPEVYQRVLENSEEGLLYNPPENGAGYVLLPIGDNYDKIREMTANIFSLPPQSDINPKP